MTTGKDTNKKTAKVRKPTQLDRIEKRIDAIEERLAKQYGWYSTLRDKHFPELQAKVDRLPVDIGLTLSDLLKSNDLIKEVEGNGEEIKLGMWVMFKPRIECPDAPTFPAIASRWKGPRSLVVDAWHCSGSYNIADLRPATSEEIAAFQQAEEARIKREKDEAEKEAKRTAIRASIAQISTAKDSLVRCQHYAFAARLRDMERELQSLIP